MIFGALLIIGGAFAGGYWLRESRIGQEVSKLGTPPEPIVFLRGRTLWFWNRPRAIVHPTTELFHSAYSLDESVATPGQSFRLSPSKDMVVFIKQGRLWITKTQVSSDRLLNLVEDLGDLYSVYSIGLAKNSWSPDGRYLAYVVQVIPRGCGEDPCKYTNKTPPAGVYVYNLFENKKKLLVSEGDVQIPGWLEDKLVVRQLSSKDEKDDSIAEMSEFFVVDPETGKRVKIEVCPDCDWHFVSMSSEGAVFAFVRSIIRGTKGRLYSLFVRQGENEVKLLEGDALGSPDVSPDGKFVAVTKKRKDSDWDLLIVDESEETHVIDSAVSFGELLWSGDNILVYSKEDGEDTGIYKINADGSGKELLFPDVIWFDL